MNNKLAICALAISLAAHSRSIIIENQSGKPINSTMGGEVITVKAGDQYIADSSAPLSISSTESFATSIRMRRGITATVQRPIWTVAVTPNPASKDSPSSLVDIQQRSGAELAVIPTSSPITFSRIIVMPESVIFAQGDANNKNVSAEYSLTPTA